MLVSLNGPGIRQSVKGARRVPKKVKAAVNAMVKSAISDALRRITNVISCPVSWRPILQQTWQCRDWRHVFQSYRCHQNVFFLHSNNQTGQVLRELEAHYKENQEKGVLIINTTHMNRDQMSALNSVYDQHAQLDGQDIQSYVSEVITLVSDPRQLGPDFFNRLRPVSRQFNEPSEPLIPLTDESTPDEIWVAPSEVAQPEQLAGVIKEGATLVLPVRINPDLEVWLQKQGLSISVRIEKELEDIATQYFSENPEDLMGVAESISTIKEMRDPAPKKTVQVEAKWFYHPVNRAQLLIFCKRFNCQYRVGPVTLEDISVSKASNLNLSELGEAAKQKSRRIHDKRSHTHAQGASLFDEFPDELILNHISFQMIKALHDHMECHGNKALLIQGSSGYGKDKTIGAYLKKWGIPYCHVNAGKGAQIQALYKVAAHCATNGKVLVISEGNLLSAIQMKTVLDYFKQNLNQVIISTNPPSYTGRRDRELASILATCVKSICLPKATADDFYTLAKGRRDEYGDDCVTDEHLRQLVRIHIEIIRILENKGSQYLPSTRQLFDAIEHCHQNPQNDVFSMTQATYPHYLFLTGDEQSRIKESPPFLPMNETDFKANLIKTEIIHQLIKEVDWQVLDLAVIPMDSLIQLDPQYSYLRVSTEWLVSKTSLQIQEVFNTLIDQLKKIEAQECPIPKIDIRARAINRYDSKSDCIICELTPDGIPDILLVSAISSNILKSTIGHHREFKEKKILNIIETLPYVSDKTNVSDKTSINEFAYLVYIHVKSKICKTDFEGQLLRGLKIVEPNSVVMFYNRSAYYARSNRNEFHTQLTRGDRQKQLGYERVWTYRPLWEIIGDQGQKGPPIQHRQDTQLTTGVVIEHFHPEIWYSLFDSNEEGLSEYDQRDIEISGNKNSTFAWQGNHLCIQLTHHEIGLYFVPVQITVPSGKKLSFETFTIDEWKNELGGLEYHNSEDVGPYQGWQAGTIDINTKYTREQNDQYINHTIYSEFSDSTLRIQELNPSGGLEIYKAPEKRDRQVYQSKGQVIENEEGPFLLASPFICTGIQTLSINGRSVTDLGQHLQVDSIGRVYLKEERGMKGDTLQWECYDGIQETQGPPSDALLALDSDEIKRYLDQVFQDPDCISGPSKKVILELIESGKKINQIKTAIETFAATFHGDTLYPHEQKAFAWQTLFESAKGCCRHVTVVCAHLFKYKGVHVRVIKNKDHRFFEIYNNETKLWESFDTSTFQLARSRQGSHENDDLDNDTLGMDQLKRLLERIQTETDAKDEDVYRAAQVAAVLEGHDRHGMAFTTKDYEIIGHTPALLSALFPSICKEIDSHQHLTSIVRATGNDDALIRQLKNQAQIELPIDSLRQSQIFMDRTVKDRPEQVARWEQVMIEKYYYDTFKRALYNDFKRLVDTEPDLLSSGLIQVWDQLATNEQVHIQKQHPLFKLFPQECGIERLVSVKDSKQVEPNFDDAMITNAMDGDEYIQFSQISDGYKVSILVDAPISKDAISDVLTRLTDTYLRVDSEATARVHLYTMKGYFVISLAQLDLMYPRIAQASIQADHQLKQTDLLLIKTMLAGSGKIFNASDWAGEVVASDSESAGDERSEAWTPDSLTPPVPARRSSPLLFLKESGASEGDINGQAAQTIQSSYRGKAAAKAKRLEAKRPPFKPSVMNIRLDKLHQQASADICRVWGISVPQWTVAVEEMVSKLSDQDAQLVIIKLKHIREVRPTDQGLELSKRLIEQVRGYSALKEEVGALFKETKLERYIDVALARQLAEQVDESVVDTFFTDIKTRSWETVMSDIDQNPLLIFAKNSNGQTALMAAASQGDSDQIDLLIERGAYIESRDRCGKSALGLAIRNSKIKSVAILLAKNASIDWTDLNGKSNLMSAAKRGNCQIADLLIQAGADIDQKSNQGQTALVYAIIAGNTDMVASLLDKGADITIKDQDGKTALEIARHRGEESIIHQLEIADLGLKR